MDGAGCCSAACFNGAVLRESGSLCLLVGPTSTLKTIGETVGKYYTKACGCSWVPLCYWVLLAAAGCCWVQLGAAGCLKDNEVNRINHRKVLYVSLYVQLRAAVLLAAFGS